VKRETEYIPLAPFEGGTGLSLQFTILIFHKQNFFGYKLVAKLLGGRNSCLERKLREEIATKPHTKGRGTQLTALEVLVTLEQ
jgi:hypothetical protein